MEKVLSSWKFFSWKCSQNTGMRVSWGGKMQSNWSWCTFWLLDYHILCIVIVISLQAIDFLFWMKILISNLGRNCKCFISSICFCWYLILVGVMGYLHRKIRDWTNFHKHDSCSYRPMIKYSSLAKDFEHLKPLVYSQYCFTPSV